MMSRWKRIITARLSKMHDRQTRIRSSWTDFLKLQSSHFKHQDGNCIWLHETHRTVHDIHILSEFVSWMMMSRSYNSKTVMMMIDLKWIFWSQWEPSKDWHQFLERKYSNFLSLLTCKRKFVERELMWALYEQKKKGPHLVPEDGNMIGSDRFVQSTSFRPCDWITMMLIRIFQSNVDFKKWD